MLNKCKLCRLSIGGILMVETAVLLGYILLDAKDNGGWGPYFNGPLTLLVTFVSLSGILSLPLNLDFQILFISLPSPPMVPYFLSHRTMATRWHHCLSTDLASTLLWPSAPRSHLSSCHINNPLYPALRQFHACSFQAQSPHYLLF